MAKVTFNNGITGVRGKLQGIVFRDHYGKTIMLPHAPPENKPSPAQSDRRTRFREAQAYARGVLADPLKQERYRQLAAERKLPPNALLISNFLNPPTIDRIDLSGWHGEAGDSIRVLASDSIEVVSVALVMRDADHAALETGTATKDHDVWVYRCTTALAMSAVTLEITAENRAGAKATETVSLG